MKILKAEEARKRNDTSLHHSKNSEFSNESNSIKISIPVEAEAPRKQKVVVQKSPSEESYISDFPVKSEEFEEESSFPKAKGRKPSNIGSHIPYQRKRPTKNIAINYGRAIVSFATSHISIPYVTPILKEMHLSLSGFITYMKKSRNTLKSMQALKNVLLVDPKDDKTIAAYKEVFQKVSEIFIKYFSVNWITHSKLTHKLVYLKYRNKMLRRVQNPECFTYIAKSHYD